MTLTKAFRAAIKDDKVKMNLALEIGVTYITLQRWLTKDNEKFATLKNIAAIQKITGLRQKQIFEPIKEVA